MPAPQTDQDRIANDQAKLRDLQQRIDEQNARINQLQQTNEFNQKMLAGQSASQNIVTQNTKTQGDLVLQQLGAQIQAQQQAVNTASQNVQFYESQNIDTVFLRDAQDRLAQERAKLQNLQNQYVATQLEVSQRVAAQSNAQQWQTQSSLISNQDAFFSALNQAQNELRSLQEQYQQTQRDLALAQTGH